MALDVDQEILQDFLIEAAEILELLSEELVELENDPENADLLNSIFRGFHTVKGGAGFLALTNLVDACHGAENVFDILRTGKRKVTAELMDVILQSLDTVNEMFAQVQAGEDPEPADPELLHALHRYCSPESEDEASAAAPTSAAPPTSGDIDGISEDEFEALLDELHSTPGKSAPPESAAPAKPTGTPDFGAGDDISDDDFEALLDELHGKGSFKIEGKAEEKPSEPASRPPPNFGGDEISDDEFESLLDELHGKGSSPTKAEKPKSTPVKKEPEAAAPAAKPAPAPKKAEPAAPAPVKAPPKEKAVPQAETTVRVDTKRLDEIMNMVGELVLVRNRLVSLGVNLGSDEEMTKAISNLDVVTGDLQGAVMKTRMQPIKKVFGRFPRVVRDLSRTLNKEITLELVGEETDLDKNLVEALADPLVHLVRNSVDHGIEMPDERESAGKPRMGMVRLSASQQGDHILLTIEDDGKGMDPEKLKQIAIDKGVLDVDSAARLSDTEAFNLIFAPGFSTKAEISEISGRGVGMDVVKTKIIQLNGSVEIQSELGKGTTLQIKVPLTLAILPTLMVVVADLVFALPLSTVNEIIHLDLTKTNIIDGQQTVTVRERAIPLFYLEDWLIKNPKAESKRSEGHVVVIQIGTQQVGFVVDSLIGQEEVVIKPLDAMLQGTPGMAGATITSDGGIALIFDVPNLLNHYARRSNLRLK
ncbi:chemotaxis protein CheA [Psychrosphaera saromensis]|uniref:Chemotaxis protein CheA n=1 Tax=Psychrosphaera saromensis TaxID=716813 RepID=A0A2S7UWY9_9GAMM|nr:chemotaxis protein CheA [Psychrosphaera saromensis]PQJ53790.1 chemotaxis protein CheA [Psychrosphaera saromensis]GHB62275.1 chemotaxis protein CheA [Psychrosphaera saromensis]GLQ15420.1 chemotaxis protein CheA [Psychrosphaera saromensis]